MKTLTKLSLIAVATLSLMTVNTFAMKTKMAKSYTLHNYEVMPSQPTKMSTLSCKKYSGKTYTFNLANKNNYVDKNLYLMNMVSHTKNMKSGVVLFHWTANSVYVDPKGKKHKRYAHGYTVSLKGTKMGYGAYDNGFCKGFYKVTW